MMRPVTQDHRDKIFNALMVGMALDDAYIFAGLSPEQILSLDEDEEFQLTIRQRNKEHEHMLLSRMNEISQKQARVGREAATAWLLEKLYPRYSSKPQPEQLDIKLNLTGVDPLAPSTREDNIDVFNPLAREDNPVDTKTGA